MTSFVPTTLIGTAEIFCQIEQERNVCEVLISDKHPQNVTPGYLVTSTAK